MKVVMTTRSIGGNNRKGMRSENTWEAEGREYKREEGRGPKGERGGYYHL